MENNSDVLQNRRALSLDGVRSQPLGTHIARPPIAQARPLHSKPRTYFKPQAAPKEHGFWQKVQLPMLLLAGAIGGFFADNLVLGLALTSGYAVFAIIRRVPSRTTFTLAFLLLGAISLMLLLKPSTQLVRNFATYAFVLLLAGVITLGREARLPKRMRRKYRR